MKSLSSNVIMYFFSVFLSRSDEIEMLMMDLDRANQVGGHPSAIMFARRILSD